MAATVPLSTEDGATLANSLPSKLRLRCAWDASHERTCTVVVGIVLGLRHEAASQQPACPRLLLASRRCHAWHWSQLKRLWRVWFCTILVGGWIHPPEGNPRQGQGEQAVLMSTAPCANRCPLAVQLFHLLATRWPGLRCPLAAPALSTRWPGAGRTLLLCFWRRT